jgi:hypothetical protein
MQNFKLTTPVAFIIFNRPDVTSKVFAEIAKVRPEKLLIIADGPRKNRHDEEEKISATRAIVEKIDWDCEVLKNYSEINLGCKKRVSSGIDWVFDNVDEAIFLEDDCLPNTSFFRFCQYMLARYRYDERIMMVSGTNLAWDLPIESDYYFSRYPHIWGWASWRRVWSEYDVSIKGLPDLLSGVDFKDSFKNKNEFKFWKKTLIDVYEGRVDTWDAQVMYLAFANSQLTIFPSKNLITNIGFGENATHTIKNNKWTSNLPTKNFPNTDDIKAPKFMIPNKIAEMQRATKEGIGVNKIIRRMKYFSDFGF